MADGLLTGRRGEDALSAVNDFGRSPPLHARQFMRARARATAWPDVEKTQIREPGCLISKEIEAMPLTPAVSACDESRARREAGGRSGLSRATFAARSGVPSCQGCSHDMGGPRIRRQRRRQEDEEQTGKLAATFDKSSAVARQGRDGTDRDCRRA